MRSVVGGTAACLLGSLSLAWLQGCDSCNSKKPYTPFTLEAGAPSERPAASVEPPPTAPSASPAFQGRKDEIAPPNSAKWQLAGRTIEAPPGRVFERAVRADFDGDVKEDIAAWLVPDQSQDAADPNGLRGELWYFPSQGAPRLLAPLPSFVPSAPTCKLTTAIAQSGPHTLTLDVAAACEARLVPRSPVRAISILRPEGERPVVLTLRLAEPAAGETLAVAADSSDRDGDGRDDVALSFSLQGPNTTKPATAQIAWLDRAAGASREANEPAKSLAAAASLEVTRAKGKNTSKQTPELLGNLRRLYATLCADSGTARVFDQDGEPLACTGLQPFVDRAATAQFTAALTQKDFVEALSVLTQDGFFHSKMTENAKKALLKDLDKALPSASIDRVLALEPVPVARGATPRYSPLRFDADGKLLMQTARGLVRISPGGGEIEELFAAPEPPPAWPLEVTNESGARFTGVTYACDRSEVLLNFSAAGQTPPEPVATRLLAPRPGACKGGRLPRTPGPVILSFRQSGLEAVVAGANVGRSALSQAAQGPEVFGSARSPDGRHVVVPTALGLLVVSNEQSELLRVSEPNWSPESTADCVVANGARTIACVVGERARLFYR